MDLVGSDCFWALLWISYALQDQQAFWETSCRLVYHEKAEDLEIAENDSDAVGFSLLPAALPGRSLTALDFCRKH